MHAASVHPEPGSNSLKIYYIRSRVIYFVLELYLSFFYFLSFSQCVLTRFLYTICVRNSVVQFSKTDAQTGFPVGDFVIILHLSVFVKTFFKTFLSFFKVFRCSHLKTGCPLLRCPISISLCFLFVKWFFVFFSSKPAFFRFVRKNAKRQSSRLVKMHNLFFKVARGTKKEKGLAQMQ